MSLTWSTSDSICTAEIARPEALNAIDLATMDRFDALLEELEGAEEVRVLVFRGAGRTFVSGGDLKEFATFESAQEVAAMSRRMTGLLERLEELDCFTVALIDGDAFGGGCELAMAFDFRLLSADARMGFTQARFAIPPGWGGLTRLVRLVGRRTALRWLATTALVDAEEAAEKGLVDLVASPEEFEAVAAEFCRRLAASPRELIKALKEGARRAEVEPVGEAIAGELEPFCRLWMEDEHFRRVQAFLTRGK